MAASATGSVAFDLSARKFRGISSLAFCFCFLAVFVLFSVSSYCWCRRWILAQCIYNLFHLSVHSFLLQWRNFLRAEVKSGVIHFKSVESGFPVINEKLPELGKVHQLRKTNEQEREREQERQRVNAIFAECFSFTCRQSFRQIYGLIIVRTVMWG